jgi:hypothetical protein
LSTDLSNLRKIGPSWSVLSLSSFFGLHKLVQACTSSEKNPVGILMSQGDTFKS